MDMNLQDGVGNAPASRPSVIVWAAAATAGVAAVVAAIVVVAPLVASNPAPLMAASAPAPAPAAVPVSDPAMLQGRWVRTGLACDTPRGDMVIAGASIVHHEGGVVRSDMTLAGVAAKSPGVFEVKYMSGNGAVTDFATFQMKDATTVYVSNFLFQSDGLWHKC